ncbi:MAG: hypothetical protein U1D64_04965 [Bacteroidales bacterium]|nr:hypothetical protein [Bacteroidales bacterium]
MRHFSTIILFLLITTGVQAQRIVRETKHTFETFGAKITKVVIPSTSLPDLMLRDAVNRGWRISPFEFCSFEEYNRLKSDTNFFFLMRVDGMYKRELEPKIEYLTLIKGGPEVKRGLYSSQNIITLPLQESDDNSGKSLHLLPVYIDIIQNHIYKVQQNILLAFKGTLSYSDRVSEIKGKELLFSTDLLGYDIDEDEFTKLFGGAVKLVSADDLEDAIINNHKNTVVPVIINPKGDSEGSFCYKLIIGTDSHELLFFRRHKVSRRLPVGFTKEDIRKISVPFRF